MLLERTPQAKTEPEEEESMEATWKLRTLKHKTLATRKEELVRRRLKDLKLKAKTRAQVLVTTLCS